MPQFLVWYALPNTTIFLSCCRHVSIIRSNSCDWMWWVNLVTIFHKMPKFKNQMSGCLQLLTIGSGNGLEWSWACFWGLYDFQPKCRINWLKIQKLLLKIGGNLERSYFTFWMAFMSWKNILIICEWSCRIIFLSFQKLSQIFYLAYCNIFCLGFEVIYNLSEDLPFEWVLPIKFTLPEMLLFFSFRIAD